MVGILVVFYKFDNIRVIELLKSFKFAQELFLMSLIHILLLDFLDGSRGSRLLVNGFVDLCQVLLETNEFAYRP